LAPLEGEKSCLALHAAMLSGGTGDKNLQPLDCAVEDVDEMLSRVRSLLVFSVENRGPKIDTRSGVKKADVMIERWKAIFSKYDDEGTGTLEVHNIKKMVRQDLKIAERLVSDAQIAALFGAIDEDGGGSVEFNEFLDFVQQPSTRGTISDQDVVNCVERAVRLAMWRNKIRVKDLASNFHAFDESGDVSTGELGANDMVRFFRKVVGLTKHECSDKALHVAFYFMDDDGSGKMSMEELMDFIKICSQENKKPELPARVPGLIGGMRCGGMMSALPERMPSRRPGTLPGSPLSRLPFCLNGRDIASGGRLASSTRQMLSKANSEPSLAAMSMRAFSSSPQKAAVSEPGEENDSPRSQCSMGCDSRMHLWSGPRFCPEPQDLGPKKRYWSGKLPSKTCGGYKTLKGAHALNLVEERLLQAGIDVRGNYHRLGRER